MGRIVHILSLAYPLKRFVADLRPDLFVAGAKPRLVLQTLGTDIARKVLGDDVWVNRLIRKVADYKQTDQRSFVIDDVRFINECKALQAAGFSVIKIKRKVPQLDHSSEQQIDEMLTDGVINNNADMVTFEKQIRFILGAV